MRLNGNEKIILGASIAAALGSLYFSYKFVTEVVDTPALVPPPPSPTRTVYKAKPRLGEVVQVPTLPPPRMGRPEQNLPSVGERAPEKGPTDNRVLG